jgi:hypothetical protein
MKQWVLVATVFTLSGVALAQESTAPQTMPAIGTIVAMGPISAPLKPGGSGEASKSAPDCATSDSCVSHKKIRHHHKTSHTH